eukprot:Amastigsp_a843235_22.p3 type:complete len:176 gc:universal Amastigsp_a843235_22:237-764(+)
MFWRWLCVSSRCASACDLWTLTRTPWAVVASADLFIHGSGNICRRVPQRHWQRHGQSWFSAADCLGVGRRRTRGGIHANGPCRLCPGGDGVTWHLCPAWSLPADLRHIVYCLLHPWRMERALATFGVCARSPCPQRHGLVLAARRDACSDRGRALHGAAPCFLCRGRGHDRRSSP